MPDGPAAASVADSNAGGMSAIAALAGFTLRARHVLPMTGDATLGRDAGSRRGDQLENGWVRVERGRIVAVGGGPRGARDAARAGGPVVDLGEAIILPGLVNAHTHLEFSARESPLPAGGGLPDWIGRVVALKRQAAAEGGAAGDAGAAAAAPRAAAIARGLAECGRGGVTTVGEIATGLDGLVPMPAGGPRLRVFREALGLSLPAIAASSRGLARDLDRLAAAGLTTGISPHAPYSVGRRLGRRLIDRAVAGRLPVAMHVAESREEQELLATGRGRFRDLLESLGAWPEVGAELLPAAEWISLLALPPRGVVVHGTFLPEDPAAFARLVRHRDRLAVAVCPRTTRALSGILPPVRDFLDAGVRVAIGTDSRASNPDLDLLAECRTLVEAGLASPLESLVMATRGGAFALGLERRVGRLASGMAADIAVLAPAGVAADPFAAAVAASTRVIATLRSGRLVADGLAACRLADGRSSR